jgi:hypothetical protein
MYRTGVYKMALLAYSLAVSILEASWYHRSSCGTVKETPQQTRGFLAIRIMHSPNASAMLLRTEKEK